MCRVWPSALPRAASRLGCANVAAIAQSCPLYIPIEGFCPCSRNEWDSSVPQHLRSLICEFLLKNYHLKYGLIGEAVRWIVLSQLWKRSPRAGDILRHLSLQYHCLVSLESGVQVSKVGPGETPMTQRSDDLQGPCECCIEVKVNIKEVYFGQAGLQLKNATILIWIKTIFLNFTWDEPWWGFLF